MIKREYHAYVCVYSEETTQIYSQHDFTLSIKSWLPMGSSYICDEVRKHAVSRSDFKNKDLSNHCNVKSLTRLR